MDRFINNEGDVPENKKSLTRTLMELLHKWHTDPQFVGPYGIPLELERSSTKGRSFKELVHAINPAVNDADALEELVRLRAVVHSGDTHIRAMSRVLIPVEEMSPAQLEFFGNALTRLADTLQFNMDAKNAAKRLEQSVISDRGLPKEVIPVFEKYVRERVTELLVEIDNWLSPYAVNEPGVAEPPERVGLAVFQFVDRVADPMPMREKVAPEPR